MRYLIWIQFICRSNVLHLNAVRGALGNVDEDLDGFEARELFQDVANFVGGEKKLLDVGDFEQRRYRFLEYVRLGALNTFDVDAVNSCLEQRSNVSLLFGLRKSRVGYEGQ